MSFRKRILAMVSMFVVGVISATPAGAVTFPGANGRIAYEQASPGRIMTVDPAGGTTTRLVGAGSTQPVWAPDGKRLAYVRGGYISVMSEGGKNLYHIPRDKSVLDSDPTWSSDGSKIAFVRTKTVTKQRAVFSVKVGSQSVVGISGWSELKNYRAPSWSPSGKEIVFEEYDVSSARLVIKNLQFGSVRELTHLSDVTESSHAAWSPKGYKILFRDSVNELYTIWTDGNRRAVISDGDSYVGSWSPDGTMIAFIEDPGDESISISEVDGSIRWVSIDKKNYDRLGAPTWSPDGTLLAFTMEKANTSDLWVVNLTTGTQRLLVRDIQGGVAWQAR